MNEEDYDWTFWFAMFVILILLSVTVGSCWWLLRILEKVLT